MLISVVIPVYNMQHTLDRCVESVLKQTFDNMEVLLVDDGSTDGSAQKCDSWAETDSRITVVHQPNGGLSKARNTGRFSSFCRCRRCHRNRHVAGCHGCF